MKDEQTEALKRFNDTQAEMVAEYVKKSNIAELEKTKEEMWKTEPNGVSFELKNNISELIGEHIAELKGEQKC